jgi:ribosome recycling factor
MTKLTVEEYSQKAGSILAHLEEELSRIRSGRAHPSLVENITVEAYGAIQPLKNIANINVVDVGLLVVQPWDKGLVPNVVKAIQESNIGINPQASAESVRLPLPPLTQERREEYVKLMKERLEESKISIRSIRKSIMNTLDEDKKNANISEDDFKRYCDELQKKVDESNKKIDDFGRDKEKDLMTI